MRRRESQLGCVARNQGIVDVEEEYIGKLVGMLFGDHGRHSYIEEGVMVQMEIIYWLSAVACICFFRGGM